MNRADARVFFIRPHQARAGATSLFPNSPRTLTWGPAAQQLLLGHRNTSLILVAEDGSEALALCAWRDQHAYTRPDHANANKPVSQIKVVLTTISTFYWRPEWEKRRPSDSVRFAASRQLTFGLARSLDMLHVNSRALASNLQALNITARFFPLWPSEPSAKDARLEDMLSCQPCQGATAGERLVCLANITSGGQSGCADNWAGSSRLAYNVRPVAGAPVLFSSVGSGTSAISRGLKYLPTLVLQLRESLPAARFVFCGSTQLSSAPIMSHTVRPSDVNRTQELELSRNLSLLADVMGLCSWHAYEELQRRADVLLLPLDNAGLTVQRPGGLEIGRGLRTLLSAMKHRLAVVATETPYFKDHLIGYNCTYLVPKDSNAGYNITAMVEAARFAVATVAGGRCVTSSSLPHDFSREGGSKAFAIWVETEMMQRSGS
jgi:glycosyltransferase involved in cell wall biosynthesis